MRLTAFLAWFVGVGAVAALLLAPVFACGCKRASPATTCLSNLKQIGTGSLLYADDHDGRLMPRDVWMDGIAPYVKDEARFHDPEGPKGGYGYAFDARLAGVKEPRDPAKAPLAYDSLNPIRNASDPLASLPRPGRHEGKNGVVYADGHARRIVQ